MIIRKALTHVYQLICLAMTMLFALLPVYVIQNPQEYGKYFVDFANVELVVLQFCFVSFALYLIVRIFTENAWTVFRELFCKIKNTFVEKKHLILFLVMYILVVISACYAPNNERAMYGTEFRPDGLMMYTCFFALFIFSFSIKSPVYRKILIVTYIFSFIIVSLIMLQQYYGILGSAHAKYCPQWAYKLRSFYEKHNIRYMFYRGESGTFYNLNHMGYYIAVCSALFTAILFKADKIGAKVIWGILCAYSYWVLIVNNTFGAFLAVLGVIIAFTGLAFFRNRKNVFHNLVPIVVFLIVTIFISVFPLIPGRSIVAENFSRTSSDVTKVATDAENSEKAGSGRWNIWVETADMISEKPLLGYGPDNLKAEYKSRDVKLDRAHCEPLEIAVNSGVFASMCYIAAYFYLFYKYLRKKNLMAFDGRWDVLGPIMAVAAYFVSALVGVFLFYTACHLFIMFGLASGESFEETCDVDDTLSENSDSDFDDDAEKDTQADMSE